MKKVISLLLVTFLCFVLTGCGSEKAMTTKKFTETMSKEGYQLNDISEQYKNNQLIDQAVVASKEHHQIELYISKDAKKSEEYFQIDLQIFGEKGNNTVKEETTKNTHTYSIIKNGKYIYISRIDNTLLFAYVNENEKTTVDKLIDKLGY